MQRSTSNFHRSTRKTILRPASATLLRTIACGLLGFGLAMAPGGETAAQVPPPPVPSPPPAVTLGELLRLALRAHPAVLEAAASARAAEVQAQGARSVYWPQLSLSGGLSGTNAITAAQTSSSPFGIGTVGVAASYDLYDVGKNSDTVGVADAQSRISAAALQAVRIDTAYQVRKAYLNWVQADRLAEVAGLTVQNTRALYDQAQAFFAQGTRARIDVTSALSALDSAQAAYLGAKADAAVAARALANSVGIAELPPGQGDFPAVPDLAFAPEDRLWNAATQSPVVQAAQARL
ncbi:MAG: TolC family protein, partial [Cyanobacteria bacterium REEB65]|nr:TolC family protein [Cyanobacteria bacterium REEB65]